MPSRTPPKTAEFEIVGDELRTPERATAPWIAAVIEGKTVKLNLKQAKMGGYYRTVERHGYKLRTRAVEDGVVVWAEAKPSEANGQS